MPFQCPECDKVFAKKGYLQIHKVLHTGEKRYKCDVCDKRFSNSSNRNAHLRIHTGEQPYECTLCDRKFSQASQLTLHKRLHSGERPYICDFCGKGFLNNPCKVRHMRVHTGEKPYQCLICGKSFAVASHMKRHMRIHTGEKPYKCGVCDKAFAESAQVDRHMRKHTGEKPFKCDICCKEFAEVSSRNRHVRAHTGEKSHKCMICSKTFSQSWHLNTHILTHKSEIAGKTDNIGASGKTLSKTGQSGFKGRDLKLTAMNSVVMPDPRSDAEVRSISPTIIEKAIDACSGIGSFVSEKNVHKKVHEGGATKGDEGGAGAASGPGSQMKTIRNNKLILPNVSSGDEMNMTLTNLPTTDDKSRNSHPVQMPSKELQMAMDLCLKPSSAFETETTGIRIEKLVSETHQKKETVQEKLHINTSISKGDKVVNGVVIGRNVFNETTEAPHSGHTVEEGSMQCNSDVGSKRAEAEHSDYDSSDITEDYDVSENDMEEYVDDINNTENVKKEQHKHNSSADYFSQEEDTVNHKEGAACLKLEDVGDGESVVEAWKKKIGALRNSAEAPELVTNTETEDYVVNSACTDSVDQSMQLHNRNSRNVLLSTE